MSTGGVLVLVSDYSLLFVSIQFNSDRHGFRSKGTCVAYDCYDLSWLDRIDFAFVWVCVCVHASVSGCTIFLPSESKKGHKPSCQQPALVSNVSDGCWVVNGDLAGRSWNGTTATKVTVLAKGSCGHRTSFLLCCEYGCFLFAVFAPFFVIPFADGSKVTHLHKTNAFGHTMHVRTGWTHIRGMQQMHTYTHINTKTRTFRLQSSCSPGRWDGIWSLAACYLVDITIAIRTLRARAIALNPTSLCILRIRSILPVYLSSALRIVLLFSHFFLVAFSLALGVSVWAEAALSLAGPVHALPASETDAKRSSCRHKRSSFVLMCDQLIFCSEDFALISVVFGSDAFGIDLQGIEVGGIILNKKTDYIETDIHTFHINVITKISNWIQVQSYKKI